MAAETKVQPTTSTGQFGGPVTKVLRQQTEVLMYEREVSRAALGWERFEKLRQLAATVWWMASAKVEEEVPITDANFDRNAQDRTDLEEYDRMLLSVRAPIGKPARWDIKSDNHGAVYQLGVEGHRNLSRFLPEDLVNGSQLVLTSRDYHAFDAAEKPLLYVHRKCRLLLARYGVMKIDGTYSIEADQYGSANIEDEISTVRRNRSLASGSDGMGDGSGSMPPATPGSDGMEDPPSE